MPRLVKAGARTLKPPDVSLRRRKKDKVLVPIIHYLGREYMKTKKGCQWGFFSIPI